MSEATARRALRITAPFMAEAICAALAFHLPGGYQAIRRRACVEEREQRSAGTHTSLFLLSAIHFPAVPHAEHSDRFLIEFEAHPVIADSQPVLGRIDVL